jgi:hypothetical protein
MYDLDDELTIWHGRQCSYRLLYRSMDDVPFA